MSEVTVGAVAIGLGLLVGAVETRDIAPLFWAILIGFAAWWRQSR